MLRKLHPDCERRLREIINGDDSKAALMAIQIVYARSIGKEKESEQLWRPKNNELAPGIPKVDLQTLSDEQLDRIHAIVREGLA
jgi:hypothetical protein